MKKARIIFALTVITFTSCATVKEYEMVNINDADMILNERLSNRFATNFQAYREAASGANGGKTGGGCGCN